MVWMLWALAVLVLGGCVVLAVGRGGQLREVYDDRPDVLVPGDRPLGAGDLRAVRFTTAFRGYRMAEVDALVARLAAELDTGPEPPPAADAPGEPGDVTAIVRRGQDDDRAG